MNIAFVMSKQIPQKIFEIKINPDSNDTKRLNDICEARGTENHMVVYLTNDECYNLAHFIKAGL